MSQAGLLGLNNIRLLIKTVLDVLVKELALTQGSPLGGEGIAVQTCANSERLSSYFITTLPEGGPGWFVTLGFIQRLQYWSWSLGPENRPDRGLRTPTDERIYLPFPHVGFWGFEAAADEEG